MGQNLYSEIYLKKIHIRNRVGLSLREKNTIVNQILFSRLWYIGQIYIIPKYLKKEIEKRIYNFFWNRKRYNLSDTYLNSPFGGADYLF